MTKRDISIESEKFIPKGFPMSVEAVKERTWDDFFVELDKKSEYVPVASTLTSISSLLLKGALSLMDQEKLDEALKSRYIQHIQDKSLDRALTLLVPVLGNAIIYLNDQKSEETSLKEETVVVEEKIEKVVLLEVPLQVAIQDGLTKPKIETMPVVLSLPKPQVSPSAEPTPRVPTKPPLIKAPLKIRI